MYIGAGHRCVLIYAGVLTIPMMLGWCDVDRPSTTAIEDWVLTYAYEGEVLHELVVKDTWSTSSRRRKRNGYFVLSAPSESFKQLSDVVLNSQLCPVLKCRCVCAQQPACSMPSYSISYCSSPSLLLSSSSSFFFFWFVSCIW